MAVTSGFPNGCRFSNPSALRLFSPLVLGNSTIILRVNPFGCCRCLRSNPTRGRESSGFDELGMNLVF